jgi:hypothetical protein
MGGFARLLVIGFACLHMTAESQAQQAPRELREKSIVLNWSEDRTMKPVFGDASGKERTSRFDATINLYVSIQGRVFSTFKRTSGRLVYDDSNQISGTGKSLLLWRFQDGALVADQAFARGARRVVIAFSDHFNACSIKVIYGKEGGTEPIIFDGTAAGSPQFEAVDEKMISTSCSVRRGNIFAGPQ